LSWREAFFSWRGRVSRGACLFGVMAISFVWAIASMLLLAIVFPGPQGFTPSRTTDTVIFASLALSLVPQASLLVRRAHDLGVSGYWLLIFVVPFAVFIMARLIDQSLYGSWIETLVSMFYLGGMLIIFFAPGQRKANRFGAPPPPGLLP
jgi:uncharacterized membrane protein YhaH (DUF805 family)